MLSLFLHRLLCGVLRVLARAGRERELELIVLRQQLAIRRRGGKRPGSTSADRALLAAANRLLPRERWSCLRSSPDAPPLAPDAAAGESGNGAMAQSVGRRSP
jgi:hypothetical protein